MQKTSKAVDCVVVGAGIVGLAIARELALAGFSVLVLEKNIRIGEETSFRNSAVLHAGIYYPATSLKAKFCVEGLQLLYDYCQEHAVPFKKIGKLIVITHPSERPQLELLLANAKANGVHSLVEIDKEEILAMEPNISAPYGIYSPNTGIINGTALMLSYQKDFLEAGGIITCNTAFVEAELQKTKLRVQTTNLAYPAIHCRYLINSAGLGAQAVARFIQGIEIKSIPKLFYAKGNYFKLTGTSPFSRLIYPLPERAGLGIHATLDLAGNVRFGPDVEWISEMDYKVSLDRTALFYKAIRTYYPSLNDGALVPDLVGIRPKITPPQNQPQDFVIQTHQQHGVKNLINLYGIESPGLTASLAIARYVKELL